MRATRAFPSCSTFLEEIHACAHTVHSIWASSPTSTPVRPPSPSGCCIWRVSSTNRDRSTPARPAPTRLALERRRGITIKAAVVSFPLDGTTVNVARHPWPPGLHRRGRAGARRAATAPSWCSRPSRGCSRRPGSSCGRCSGWVFRPCCSSTRSTVSGRRSRAPSGGDPPASHPDILPMGAGCRLGTSRSASFEAFRPEDSGFREREIAALAEHDDALLAAFVEGREQLTAIRLRSQTRRADAGGRAASRVRRFGGHRCRCRRPDGRDRGAAADDSARRSAASHRAGCSRSSGARRVRRSPTSGCSPDRSRVRTLPGVPGRAVGEGLRGPAVRGRRVGARGRRRRRDRSADSTGFGAGPGRRRLR